MRLDDYDHLPIDRRQRLWFGVVVAVLGLVMVACNLCGCASGIGSSPIAAPSAPQMPVARLDSSAGYCTAWDVGDGLAVTAAHCCTADSASYHLSTGDAPPGAAVRVLALDTGTDACVVATQMFGPPLVLAQQDPEIGDPVWSEGFANSYLVVTGGYWSGRDDASPERSIASLATAPGASGAPVVDRYGHAVGLVSAMPAFYESVPVTEVIALRVSIPVTSMARVATLEAVRAIVTRGRAVLAGQIPGVPAQ